MSRQTTTIRRKVAFLREYASNGLRIIKAAEAIQVTPHTVHSWVRKDPDFKEMMENCMLSVTEKAKSNLIVKIEAGDTDISKYWLERHDDTFRPKKQDLELSGGVTINIVEKVLDASDAPKTGI
jgi:hypothetical protein